MGQRRRNHASSKANLAGRVKRSRWRTGEGAGRRLAPTSTEVKLKAGTLEPGLFSENVRTLKEQLQELEAHGRDLEAQAAHYPLPELDRAHILALLDDFEAVFASGTNPQRKHLLHQVVKEVRVHGRLSIEVTYFVPQPGPGGSPVMTQPHWLPGLPGVRTDPGPEKRQYFASSMT